jgi:hypothetical protein
LSSPLAIAGVTQVLRDRLNDRFVNRNVSGQLGTSIIVSTLPPDKVVQQNGIESTQLNLFLRHVTPNIAWRNEGLPSRDGSGRKRLSNPPLALNLHYLISAYGSQDLHAEILLGHAMQLMHERPVITRENVRTALNPPPVADTSLPEWLRALGNTGLADQAEQLLITPEFLNTEEMSKFWTSTLAHYRPSAAYQISVVLIQTEEPASSPLPVLVRRIDARPEFSPRVPTIARVESVNDLALTQIDVPVELHGSLLGGGTPRIRLFNDRFGVDEVLTPSSQAANRLSFTISQSSAAEFPAGFYRISAEVTLTGEPQPRVTNELSLILAPSFTGPAAPVVRAPDATADFSLAVQPPLRAGQVVRLAIGTLDFAPQPFADQATTLTFSIPGAPVGQHIVRLRVDGIDSPIIDTTVNPPAFNSYRLTIT